MRFWDTVLEQELNSAASELWTTGEHTCILCVRELCHRSGCESTGIFYGGMPPCVCLLNLILWHLDFIKDSRFFSRCVDIIQTCLLLTTHPAPLVAYFWYIHEASHYSYFYQHSTQDYFCGPVNRY